MLRGAILRWDQANFVSVNDTLMTATDDSPVSLQHRFVTLYLQSSLYWK